MNQKKNHPFRTIFKVLLIFFNILAALALLFSFMAQIIRPTFSTLVAYCGLFFPYLFFVNAGLVVVWLFFDYRWALLSVAMILLNVNTIDKHFQLHGQEKPERCAGCIKVMSYNARLFGVYNTDRPLKQRQLKKQIIRYIQKEKPDILCIQEYFNDKSGKLKFRTTEDILKALDLQDNERSYRLFLPIEGKREYQYGLAVFSRYRILDCHTVHLNDSSANRSMYVDIRYNGDTLRVYNIHLSSMHIDYDDYETGYDIRNTNLGDPKINRRAMKLYNKVAKAFDLRQAQAIAVRQNMDSCRHPMIICGDFNDTPASFSYHKIARGLKDSFRSSGKGIGRTYCGESFPSYRIDYILHDRQYNDFGHCVGTELTVSDHYPIYTYISIIEKK